MKNLLTLISLLCLWTGCGTPHVVRDAIAAADTLADEYPDSALNLMRRVERRKLRSAKDRALYGLVYSKVLDKNYVDVDRDSLIRSSVDYYAGRGPADRQALAYYYWGRTLENADSTSRAIEAFTLARRALGDDTLCRTYALICNRLGDAHETQYEFESAARMFRSSVNTFAALGEKYNEMIGYQRLVRNAIISGDYPSAKVFNSKLHILASGLMDTTQLISHSIFKANIIAYDEGNYSNAIKIIDSLIYLKANVDYIQLYGLISNLHYKNRNFIKAKKYVYLIDESRLDLGKQVGLLELKGNIEHESGNFMLASKLRDNLSQLRDSLYICQKKASIEKILRKYNCNLLLNYTLIEKNKHKYQLTVVLLTSLFLLILLLMIIIIWSRKLKRQEIFIEEQKNMIEDFKYSKHKLIDELNTIENIQNKLRNILSNRFEQIKNIACTKHLYENSKTLKEKIDALVFDNNIFVDIEETVNLNHNSIMVELRKGVYGKFAEADFRLLSMIIFGFSIQECQIFMSYSSDNIYARRSRIRSKIRLSEGPQKEYLLANF